MNQSRQQVLKIGLTGGIASGKSAVADMFRAMGVPIIDTDEIARQVVEPGQPGLTAVIDRFGIELLTDDGHLNRRKLRQMIFADETRRRDLEQILHPLIRTRMLALAEQAGGPYQVIVVPLLLESGFDALVDRVLAVDCTEEQQRQRLLERDEETPERIDRILAAQAPRAQRLVAADDVIDNTGSLDQTRLRVMELHDNYLRMAA